MGSICKEILTKAAIEDVWSAIRDIGALHTRLVPGFVTDTRVEPGARIVTFGNGMVLREPIITVDDNARRVVWSAEGGPFTHYNASLQAFAEDGATRVVWIADFLPDEIASNQQAAMDAALQVMKTTLDRLAENQARRRLTSAVGTNDFRQDVQPIYLCIPCVASCTPTRRGFQTKCGNWFTGTTSRSNSSSRSMPSATIFIASSTLVAFERAAVILREMER